MTINTNISDLFFNRDLDACREYARDGEFDGFNDEKLREEAVTFLGNLRALGVKELPTVDDLITDLYARI